MIIEKLNFISFVHLLKMLILAFGIAHEKMLLQQVAHVFSAIEENELFADEKFKEIIVELSKKVNKFAINPNDLDFRQNLLNEIDFLMAKFES